MIRTLRRNHQFFILLIFFYGVSAVLTTYFSPGKHFIQTSIFGAPFIQGEYHEFTSNQNAKALVLVFLMAVLLLGAFGITRIVIRHQLVSSRSQFTALFYLAISVFALHSELYSGALLAAVFLILVLERVVGAIDERGTSYRFLDAGMLLAVGSMFYFNLVFLFPFLWLSQWILRPSNWRELLFSVIGLIIPAIYLLTAAYILGISISSSWDSLKSWVVLGKSYFTSWQLISSVLLYMLSAVVASLYAIRKFSTSKIQVRKLLQILFLLFLNILFCGLLIPSVGSEVFYLMAVPISVLLAVYFTECKVSIFTRLLLLFLIIAPLALNFLV